jgi:hypothetical protein
MVGKITNSHENNRFDGVPKSFIDQGYNYIIGNESCKILCVQTGYNTNWKNEEVVVAESFAKIKLNGNTYEVDEFPQSNIQGITDARFWKINGELTNTALLKIKNVTLIATGSPAKQSWKNWLK